MSRLPRNRRPYLAAAAAGVIAISCITQAHAQRTLEERAARRAEKQAKQTESTSSNREQQYPDATRKPAITKASAKGGAKLQQMLKLYEDEKAADARAAADAILATETFNAYERAFAAQLAGQIAYEGNDIAGALRYWQTALELDGLDNNAHYGLMFNLAQIQLQEDQVAESQKTLDRFLGETRSQAPEHLAFKGNLLYRQEKYPEAISALKQAIEASPKPRSDWEQILMAAYGDAGQTDQAIGLAEKVAAAKPDDTRAQKNLAITYYNNERYAQASAALEKLRAAGKLTEENDYRLLYASYRSQDGREKDVVNVIKEGLDKGILKPDHQSYVVLGEAYYYSDQPVPAIEAYRKAAPLDNDGETYLNLARLLWQENRIPEAKDAAKQAISKGLRKPEEARKILALPSK